MGIFRTKVKQGKTYSMAEAIKILSKEEYQGYTTQEIGNGKYKIIITKESRTLESRTRQKENFHNSINGGGSFRKLVEEQPPKYGDWRANAKRYNPKELTR